MLQTRTVQVPVETMVPKEETVMVPRVKMVPVRAAHPYGQMRSHRLID